ncbi:RNA-binding protein 1 [Folsomia candida]|uniref:RNA-binding protein 1 n=1 Tax=Folsomia candida TaxID=158441 RepID=A0A226E7B0_FOLCA|nr:RNA-binding protein 1 [Folsomia candida]
MSRHRDWDLSCKVYVGNLGNSASKNELESSFGKYGPLKNVWVARNPPGFAFIEFEDPRDAEDAVRHLDGTRLCGILPVVGEDLLHQGEVVIVVMVAEEADLGRQQQGVAFRGAEVAHIPDHDPVVAALARILGNVVKNPVSSGMMVYYQIQI